MIADKKQDALRLRQKGYGYRRIGQTLGISTTSARRLVVPGYTEHLRVLSLEAKRRRTGICVDCGAITRYAGHGQGTSKRCVRCAKAVTDKVMLGRVQKDMLALLASRGPMRYTDLIAALRITTDHGGVLLHRAVRRGLVVRLSRGLYALPPR